MTLKDADKIKEAIKNSDDFVGGSDDIIKVIDSVPEVVIDTDTISRQQAIEEAKEWIEAVYCDHDEIRERMAIKHVINGIKQLPPAQPENRTETHACDYISRQAAIDAAMQDVSHIRTHEFNAGATRAANRIKQLPSAEPKIVRCKDCKHWIPYDWMFSEIWQSKNIADYPEDEIGCNWSDMAMKANDFCSRAERRTG